MKNDNKTQIVPMTQHQINECMEALDLELDDYCCTPIEIETVQNVYDYLAQFKNKRINHDEN